MGCGDSKDIAAHATTTVGGDLTRSVGQAATTTVSPEPQTPCVLNSEAYTREP
jgi:hypothetical protein